MKRSVGAAALVMLASTSAAAATLTLETLAAWDNHIAAIERRIDNELASRPPVVPRPLEGRTVHVPGGMIQQWRGAIFLPGVALDALLERLQNPPEQGPHQEDVAALRVLRRRRDGLDLYIRMTRRKLVSVTYDTEHRVTFRRHGPRRASSRSVATKIAEVGSSGDRGFLWRLNAYWRYEQIVGGVIVELESLTLSRDVPFGLGSIVEPIVDRVARDSVNRTLDHLRRTYGH
jgi:hypothetical protein